MISANPLTILDLSFLTHKMGMLRVIINSICATGWLQGTKEFIVQIYFFSLTRVPACLVMSDSLGLYGL